MNEYQPRKQFLKFHLRNNRWACIVAHRRAGKTVACVNELLTRGLASTKPSPRFSYTAPFYKQVKRIAWDYLKYYGMPIISKINESELYVDLHNGARISLFGADNPDALRGVYNDGVILDEPADMRPNLWGTVIRPTLADRKGWAAFIGTPKGHNEFYKIYQQSQNSEWFSMMLRASESGILSAEELADLQKTMSEDQYEQELECSFEAAILGAVYGKWVSQCEKDGRVKTNLYDPDLPVHTAWDLGRTDYTAIWFYQMAYNEIRLIDYFEMPGSATPNQDKETSIQYFCRMLHEKGYKYGKHYVPHDAAYKLLAANGRSIVEQAKDCDTTMFVVPAQEQQNGIETARLALKYSWFDRDKCVDGIEALKQYQFEFDEEKKVFKPKPRHDWSSHAADAFEIVGQVWKNPVIFDDKPKAKFLHDLTAKDVFWPSSTSSPKRERI